MTVELHEVSVPDNGAPWQAFCTECGALEGPQYYLDDAEDDATNHVEHYKACGYCGKDGCKHDARLLHPLETR